MTDAVLTELADNTYQLLCEIRGPENAIYSGIVQDTGKSSTVHIRNDEGKTLLINPSEINDDKVAKESNLYRNIHI